MEAIHRYKKTNVVSSSLNPLEDIISWVEGLTSVKYVESLLRSEHCLEHLVDIHQRSEDVTKLVSLALKYLEQAENGPKEISFLPLYYSLLNLSKAYIAIGPYGDKLKSNRWHGASYNPAKEMDTLEDDFIILRENGAIPLFYRTLVGESMFQNLRAPVNLAMRDVYPYIFNISAEYNLATGNQPRLVPFSIQVVNQEGKQRVVATYEGSEPEQLDKVEVTNLQAFKKLHREAGGATTLVSEWYDKGDTASLQACLRSAMLYNVNQQWHNFQLVPEATAGSLLLPEELRSDVNSGHQTFHAASSPV